jgi:hypothetical protein
MVIRPVNNELYQSQEPADVVAIPHSDVLLNSGKKVPVFLFLFYLKLKTLFLKGGALRIRCGLICDAIYYCTLSDFRNGNFF